LVDQNRYEEAQRLYQRALAIREKTSGPGHPATAHTLNNLGILLMDLGRFEEARPLYERALEIRENTLGPNHLDTAQSLNNLAVLLLEIGRYEEVRPLFERALAIHEAALGPEHGDVATSLSGLAALFMRQGRSEEALPLYERALAIDEHTLGQEHPQTAQSLQNLASALYGQGRYAEALPLYERALAIWEKFVGPEHPGMAKSLNGLAALLAKQGRYEEARALYERVLKGTLRHLDRELPTMSEAGRLRLLAIGANPQEYLASIAMVQDPRQLRDALALYFQWKSKATRLQAASLRLAQLGETEELQRRRGAIRELGKQLSDMVLLPLAEQAEDHGKRITVLREQRLRLERELNRDLGIDLILATPGVEEVQAALPADAVLVGFFAGSKVFAWVLAPTGDPQLVALGDRKRLRAAQTAFLRTTAVRGGAALEAGEPDPAAALLDLLWEPLREAVGSAATVLVIPDGFLCELPLGILREADGRYLLEVHRFAYLSGATWLTEVDGASPDREGDILAVGDVDFFKRSEAPGNSVVPRAARSRIGDTWQPLPATREELLALRTLHDGILKWETTLQKLDGEHATEEAVRQSMSGIRYLHLATHGYFEPDNLPSLLRDAEEKQATAQLGDQVQAVGLLPGLLSGLVFAGVNAAPDPARDDGYLSAEEIQYLDLSACDLAVLSACETALGSQRAGEGLMSLRRAFEVAGAKTVVSSLWKIDDRATATLMRWFYENYLVKGLEKNEALHLAKLRMLRQNRADYQGDARPSTWGAFVLSGDWQ
ncbi:MAG TPA: tetratricopeptide repeat protein, partial [Planctomycetota bacterium]